MSTPTLRKPQTPTTRVEAFSDGVFAVAITLLVLDLHVNAPAGKLASALGHEWPHYATYVVSFVTIGIIWVNHHAQFERIERVDRPLLFLDLFLLLTVTAIPFPTGLLADHLRTGSDQHVAAAVYSATLLTMGLAFFSTYLWAARRQLFSDWLSAEHVAYLVRRNGLGQLIYATAVGLAFVNAIVSLVLCAIVAIYYVPPARADISASSSDAR